jgi:hypothetical protein
MRIDKAGQDYLPGTVYFCDSLAILDKPRIAKRIFGGAHGNNPAAHGKNAALAYYPEFLQV